MVITAEPNTERVKKKFLTAGYLTDNAIVL